MAGYEKILAAIPKITEPEKLRQLMKNARAKGAEAVEKAAFQRLVEVLPAEAPGTLEYEFWKTLHAFEEILTQENGRTTRLSRTRQKVGRVGERQTLEGFAEKPTEGFKMLMERNLPELTGEALILRHAVEFSAEAVAVARARLVAAGANLKALGISEEGA